MKPVHWIFTLLCMLGMAPQALAFDEIPWPTPKLVRTADLIVVGTAAEERGKTVIGVSMVLKGDKAERVVLSRATAGKYADVVIRPGNKGVFLLRKEGAEYAPFNYRSYLSLEQLEAVQAALKMVADPGPYLDARKFPESTDLIYELTERFTGWSVSSKEVASLQWMGPPFYEVAPWQEKGVVTLKCQSDPKNGFQVSVTSAEPKGALGERLKHHLLVGFKWSSARQALPPHFSVTLDARLPARAGSATAGEAMQYLRDRLKSSDTEIVLAALLALAKMRDLDAVSHVLQLLGHSDHRVRVYAIRFLGWSRDERAVTPLGEMLAATAAHYPKDHDLSDTAAEALGKLGNKASLPILERAAGYGVQRACEAVGVVGETKSFDPLLTSLERDSVRCSHITFTLYWLVRRSNKNTEAWMMESRATQAKETAKVPRWRAWWDLHQKDFQVLKSQEEAVNESIQVR